MKLICCLLMMVCLISCDNAHQNSGSKDSVIYSSDKIPETRKSVNPNPIKTYNETVKSFETTDEFKVELYETNETFNYLIKIKYKQLDAEDTLRIPNVGEMPQPQIIKGEKRPSCIVGFLDNNKQFRESKLVYFEDSMIKVHVLKYYGVSSSK